MKLPKKVVSSKTRPRVLGELIDELYSLRQERLGVEAQAKAIKESEKKLEDRLLKDFDRAELSKAAGKLATVTVTPKVVPNVVDWDKLYAYIMKNKAFELLHRRVNEGAWSERREHGEDVPGTESFTALKVSVHKLGTKN